MDRSQPIIGGEVGDWNLFFATTAGSAATLVGLLFVATQLHLGVFSDPKNRWAALAQSTLTILATAFALSLSFLIPMLSTQVRGEIILLGAAVAIWRGIRIWWPVFRLTDKDRGHLFVQSFWLLLLPFAVSTYLLTGAAGSLKGQATRYVHGAGALLTMSVVAPRNPWRRVVTVEQEGH